MSQNLSMALEVQHKCKINIALCPHFFIQSCWWWEPFPVEPGQKVVRGPEVIVKCYFQCYFCQQIRRWDDDEQH